MNQNDFKKMLKEKSIDPLLIAIANKGYQWIIKSELTEEEAISFEQYILNNTTAEELEKVKTNKKSVSDFIEWKYISHLNVEE